MEPVDISLHNALNTNAGIDPVRNAHREAQPDGQRTRGMEKGGVSIQSQNRTPNTTEPVNTRHVEPALERPDESGSGTDPRIMKMLEELAKRIENGEKNIEENDKKSAAPKPIPKKFRMLDIPKYNGTTDPNEQITTYTCGIKENDLKDDEIESVLLKKFGETLSKGAMIWYHNLPPNSIDSFAILANSFMKAHAGAMKVATRKFDVFKIKQRKNEMLREFVSRFQSPVSDDWAV
ncbi:PREDICTED: uncharacterized protein LOC109238408 [Nicotiana attenuata]|uniref:uncharacterized protein LOC109238408 n=1 Tax=Nicotiana attenuata TaxID=49451 RepID=UPI0009053F66|nr:PREDICTED: uncharacterized protein LOC109238408 [Nicotiana attenuata]